jgi:predicted anti-sigma-YlaC factor YlaD
MNCQEIQLLFSEYFDHELSGEVESAVREHFADCPSCLHEYNNFEKGIKILKKYKSLDIPRIY